MADESGTFCGDCGPRRHTPDDTIDKTIEAGYEPTRGRYTLVIHCIRCGRTSFVTVPDDTMQDAYDGPGPAPMEQEAFDEWAAARAWLKETEDDATRADIEATLDTALDDAPFDGVFPPDNT